MILGVLDILATATTCGAGDLGKCESVYLFSVGFLGFIARLS